MRREMLICGALLLVPAGLALFTVFSGAGGGSESQVRAPDERPKRAPVAKSNSERKRESAPPAPDESEKPSEDAPSDEPETRPQSGSVAEARQAIQEERDQLHRRLATAEGEERDKLVRYESVLRQLENAVLR